VFITQLADSVAKNSIALSPTNLLKEEIDQVANIYKLIIEFFTNYSFQLIGAAIIFVIGYVVAGKIAKNLVEKELCTNKESFMTIVQTAVNALGSSAKEIKIHLHPQSATYIRENIGEDDDKSCWEILDDPSMGIGDCKVSCDNSIVDSDLDDRIDLIIAQFLEEAREGGNG